MRILSALCLGCVLPLLCLALRDECADDELVLVLPQYTFGYATFVVGPLVVVICCLFGCYGVCKGIDAAWICLCISCFCIVASVVLTLVCNASLREPTFILTLPIWVCCACCCACCCVVVFCLQDQECLWQRQWNETWQQIECFGVAEKRAAQLMMLGGADGAYQKFTLREGEIHQFQSGSLTWAPVPGANEGAHCPMVAIACSASVLYAISKQHLLWRHKFESVSDLSSTGWEAMACPFKVTDVCAYGGHIYVLSEDGKMLRQGEATTTAWEYVGDSGGVSAIAVGSGTIYGVKGQTLHKAPNPMRGDSDSSASLTPQLTPEMWAEVKMAVGPEGIIQSVNISQGHVFLLEVKQEWRCSRKKASSVVPLPAQPSPQSIGLRGEAASDERPPSLDMVA